MASPISVGYLVVLWVLRLFHPLGGSLSLTIFCYLLLMVACAALWNSKPLAKHIGKHSSSMQNRRFVRVPVNRIAALSGATLALFSFVITIFVVTDEASYEGYEDLGTTVYRWAEQLQAAAVAIPGAVLFTLVLCYAASMLRLGARIPDLRRWSNLRNLSQRREPPVPSELKVGGSATRGAPDI